MLTSNYNKVDIEESTNMDEMDNKIIDSIEVSEDYSNQ
ncbi:hypothetical protein QEW_4669 [Clostridioides difficile CD160]|nr:hypothetical protein QEW_4669 [Clostridioides difficile CD160]